VSEYKLLPCPFCGTDDDLHVHDKFFVSCANCGATCGSDCKPAAQQVEIWNDRSRSEESRLRRERDLLGEALGKILVASGMINPDMVLTGPHLLQFGAEYLEHLNEKS